MSPETAAKEGKSYKRRILVVNPRFQYKFVAVVMACAGVALVVAAADMLGLGTSFSVEGASRGEAWAAFLIKAAVYMGGVFIVGLVVSHRVAGPVYRFEKSLEEVAAGNLAYRVFLRKGDEWEEFRESFNAMVEELQRKVSEDVSRASFVRRALEELYQDASLSEGARETARRALADVSAFGKKSTLSEVGEEPLIGEC
jgi:methyl-accepting chemotaxis protein